MVVLERARVMSASAPAVAAGVRYGMRRGGVLALLPQAVQHERSLAREAQALQGAAMALLRYTPQASFGEDATILLDIGASLRLFGGIRALCRQVHRTVTQLGLTGVVGCAPTAAGAALLVRHGGGNALKQQRLDTRLDCLPVSALPAAAPCLEWLAGLGCNSLGMLRQLPRDGLQRRGDRAMQQVLQQLDCAYGIAPELLAWIDTPAHFLQRIELPERIEYAEAALHTVQTLLVQLCGWLTARQLAVTHVRLQLEHERGRHAIAPTRLELQLATPTWQDSYLKRLLKERLTRLAVTAPIIAVSLEAIQTEAMAPISEHLFPEPGGSPADQRRLEELLVARLGADNVLTAAPLADHRPELANGWCSVMTPMTPMTLASWPPTLPPRPAWLLSQPRPLTLRDHRPYYGSPLRLLSPPERIEAGWWNGAFVTRDYYVAEAANHCHYWIYRERIGDVDGIEPHWYLHGIFG